MHGACKRPACRRLLCTTTWAIWRWRAASPSRPLRFSALAGEGEGQHELNSTIQSGLGEQHRSGVSQRANPQRLYFDGHADCCRWRSSGGHGGDHRQSSVYSLVHCAGCCQRSHHGTPCGRMASGAARYVRSLSNYCNPLVQLDLSCTDSARRMGCKCSDVRACAGCSFLVRVHGWPEPTRARGVPLGGAEFLSHHASYLQFSSYTSWNV